MGKRPSLLILICLGWATSIYLTSSTVILPHDFFDWFHENVFRNDAAFRRFQTFWGLWWLVIVKGWHVTEFAVLMLLAAWTLDELTNRPSRQNVLIGGLLCIVYAASDEWHQTFVPQRGGVVYDVLIDALGVLVVSLVLLRRRRTQPS